MKKEEEMNNRRRKRFIDSAVQGALLRRLILHWFIFLVIACIALPLWRVMYTTGFSQPFSSLMLQSWMELAPVFLVLIAMVPIFVWDTITFSHRFAGPMYRFHSTIRGILAGNRYRNIKLRKGDFWTDFADDLNQLGNRVASQEQPEAKQPEPLPIVDTPTTASDTTQPTDA